MVREGPNLIEMLGALCFCSEHCCGNTHAYMPHNMHITQEIVNEMAKNRRDNNREDQNARRCRVLLKNHFHLNK